MASELANWFGDIVELWSSVYLEASSSTAHREAAVLQILSRHAKLIIESPLDSRGVLYKSLTLALTAACWRHGVVPAPRHWLAALKNVLEVRSRLAEARAEGAIVPFATTAGFFKDLFGEALIHAGVTDQPTILVEENRRASLGLAVNWGLRLVIAYALEIQPARRRDQMTRDLQWIHRLLAAA